MVSLSTHLHGLLKVLGASGQEHELLESEGVAGVGATVDDVESRAREDEVTSGAGKVGKVLVERNTLYLASRSASKHEVETAGEACLLGGSSLGHGHRDTENGVGTELALVGSTIKLDQEVINGLLVGDVEVLLDESGGNDIVDVGNSLVDTCVLGSQLLGIPCNNTKWV